MKNKKCLIAYFSHRGENYVKGNIVDLKVGNTEIVAKMIADYTQGELFHIEKKEKYPFEYRKTVEAAKAEYKAAARPVLTAAVENINKYDVIFVGYPNWCGTMPMPVWTFFDSYDFSGKVLIPFCTHEGSGMGNSEKDIKKLCPDADIRPGKAILGNAAADANEEIAEWLSKVLV
ncbi:MAG: flavodoxin [Bacillota bacterium]|jgi:flavodoxin